MNPLKQKEFKLLEDTGHADLARKVNEIVRELNKKPEEDWSYREKSKFDEVAEAIFEADNPYDVKEILFDYISKLK